MSIEFPQKVLNMKDTIIVSGLPRSCTSMVMKMLDAGGAEIVTDNIRKPDRDNPKGYFEFEKAKQLHKDATWLYEMRGKVIRVISHLLYYLPKDISYKIIFVRRNLQEILDSQHKMYVRLQGKPDDIEDSVLAGKFEAHLKKTDQWMKRQKHMEVLYVDFKATIENLLATVQKIRKFLGNPLDPDAMASVVDPGLYRNKEIG